MGCLCARCESLAAPPTPALPLLHVFFAQESSPVSPMCPSLAGKPWSFHVSWHRAHREYTPPSTRSLRILTLSFRFSTNYSKSAAASPSRPTRTTIAGPGVCCVHRALSHLAFLWIGSHFDPDGLNYPEQCRGGMNMFRPHARAFDHAHGRESHPHPFFSSNSPLYTDTNPVPRLFGSGAQRLPFLAQYEGRRGYY